MRHLASIVSWLTMTSLCHHNNASMDLFVEALGFRMNSSINWNRTPMQLWSQEINKNKNPIDNHHNQPSGDLLWEDQMVEIGRKEAQAREAAYASEQQQQQQMSHQSSRHQQQRAPPPASSKTLRSGMLSFTGGNPVAAYSSKSSGNSGNSNQVNAFDRKFNQNQIQQSAANNNWSATKNNANTNRNAGTNTPAVPTPAILGATNNDGDELEFDNFDSKKLASDSWMSFGVSSLHPTTAGKNIIDRPSSERKLFSYPASSGMFLAPLAGMPGISTSSRSMAMTKEQVQEARDLNASIGDIQSKHILSRVQLRDANDSEENNTGFGIEELHKALLKARGK